MSPRPLALAGTALVFAALSFGCDLNRVEESSVEELRFDTGPRPRIEVRLQEGSIEVLASESNRVEAGFVKRARSVDEEVARTLLDRIEVGAERSGDRIRFESRFESSPPVAFGRDLRTDLTLRVPPGSELDLHTEDGRIRIEGLAGRVVAETGDGRILVERTSGELVLRTADGAIVGRGLEGDVDASTDDGEIELDGSFRRLRAVSSDGRIRVDVREPSTVTGEWIVRTADGSISLTLPRSADADVEAVTSDGRIENHLSSFEGTEREGRLRGRIGRGGPLIFVSTMDGNIELRDR